MRVGIGRGGGGAAAGGERIKLGKDLGMFGDDFSSFAFLKPNLKK